MATQDVLVYSAVSEIHSCIERDGELLGSEGCNLDDLDHATKEVLAIAIGDPWPAALADRRRCHRCFPFQDEPQGEPLEYDGIPV